MKMKKTMASAMAILCSLSIAVTAFAGTEGAVPETVNKEQKTEAGSAEPQTGGEKKKSAVGEEEKDKQKDNAAEKEGDKKKESAADDSKEKVNQKNNGKDTQISETDKEKKEEEKKPEKKEEVKEPEKGAQDSTSGEKAASEELKEAAAEGSSLQQENDKLRKTGNTNTAVNTSQTYNMSWGGSGTKEDPWYPLYPKEAYKNTSRNVLVVQAVDTGAKVNGQAKDVSLPLSYGTNICEFYVVASDGETIGYYSVEVYRNKQPQGDWHRNLGVAAPSAAGASDGKILYLNGNILYDYRAKGQEDWIPVPAGSTEISNLAAGQYEVRFAETADFNAGYNTAAVNIYALEEYAIHLGDGLPADVKALMEVPDKAAYGSSVTLRIHFSSRKLVSKVSYKSTPDGFFSSGLSGFDYFEGNTYVLVFKMPKNDVYITEVVVNETDNWHTITQKDIGLAGFIAFRPEVQDSSNLITKQDINYYKHGGKVDFSFIENDPISYKVSSFEVQDSKGTVVAKSEDGAKISVEVNDDLTVIPSVTVYYADLTELEKVLAQAPTAEELSLYTDETARELADCLALAPNMKRVTKSDQKLVDEFIKKLEKAVADLKYRDANFAELQKSLDRIPKDLGDYSEDSLKTMNDLAKKAKAAIDENWDARRQAEVDELADQLNAAIDGLKLRLADYSKVEAVKKKVPDDLSIYTDASVKKLQDALGAVKDNLDFTHQDEVDQMASELEAAIKGLVTRSADYSKVEAAKKKVPKDLSVYTDASVKKLKKALDAVKEDLDITHQKEVDQMASDLETAIRGLVKKESGSKKTSSGNDKKDTSTTTKSAKTKDASPVGTLLLFGALSGLGALALVRRKKEKKA